MKVNKNLNSAVLIFISTLNITSSLRAQRCCAKSTLRLPVGTQTDIMRPRAICGGRSRHNSHALASSINRCDQYAEILSKPRWGGPIFGPIVRYLNTIMIGVIFSIILRVFNKFTSVRRELLTDKIFDREKGRGLLTVSNHQSMADDPGLFAALIPWWRIRSQQMRWVLCTEDVFFYVSYTSNMSSKRSVVSVLTASNRTDHWDYSPVYLTLISWTKTWTKQRKWLQSILAGGNVVPLDRSGSLEQPLFQMFQRKIAEGSWCHIFPEGKVRTWLLIVLLSTSWEFIVILISHFTICVSSRQLRIWRLLVMGGYF